MSGWSHEGEGVVIMPSGRTVRGRALRRPLPDGPPPEFGLYLATREPARVEVACAGGIGRTGTALACLAILDRIPAADAVAYVPQRYNRRAVETPAQRRYVAGFDHKAD